MKLKYLFAVFTLACGASASASQMKIKAKIPTFKSSIKQDETLRGKLGLHSAGECQEDCSDDGFPGDPPEELSPLRFGTAKIKVYKSVTVYDEGSVDTQNFKLCDTEIAFAIYDARGKSNYAIIPPDNAYFHCPIEYQSRRGDLVVIPSGLINDELPFVADPETGRERVDNKTLEAGAFFVGDKLPSDIYLKRVPYYSVTSKDLKMKNVMFGQSYWSDNVDICWSEPTLPSPEKQTPGSQYHDDGPSPDDPISNPGCPAPGDVVEDFYFEVEMNDTEA